VSNSIAFILVQADLSPDLDYLNYVTDFATICDGISEYRKEIPIEKDNVLMLAYYQNLMIDSDLRVQTVDKCKPPQVNDYISYKQFLSQSLQSLSQNAGDPHRRIKYSPLATISRGYDSTACAALALQCGCSKVLTVAGPGKYVNDCGTNIAKTMGYEQIIEVLVDSYKGRDRKMIEPLFMASGELGTDCFWASFEEHLPETYVVIGINGDKVWDINSKSITTSIKRSSPSATSLGEYRLRTGFIQVPVPFFGCVNHPAIHRISISDEMQPWVLHNDYDRPIPRRIVEEMGVERHLFGNMKIGIGFNMQWYPLFRIRKEMAAQSFNSFLKFYRNHKRKRSKIKFILQCVRYYLFAIPKYYNRLVYHLNLKSLRLPDLFPRRFSDSPFASSFLFLWGIHHAKREYTIKK
jgi:hypothetical protein